MIVHTNTNIKMLISLPIHLTVEAALPLIERKYAQVVQQNLPNSHEDGEEHVISQVTLNDCFIPLSEDVADVLSNNDQIHVVIARDQQQR